MARVRCAAPPSPRGFTLLEVLVAFAIAALLLTIVPMSGVRMLESARYHGSVRDTLADLRAARSSAMSFGEPVAFLIDAERAVVGVDKLARVIPPGVRVSAIVAGEEIRQDGLGRIVFYPDGTSTGGSIMLIRERTGSGVRLRVDWLLGRVSQERLEIGSGGVR